MSWDCPNECCQQHAPILLFNTQSATAERVETHKVVSRYAVAADKAHALLCLDRVLSRWTAEAKPMASADQRGTQLWQHNLARGHRSLRYLVANLSLRIEQSRLNSSNGSSLNCAPLLTFALEKRFNPMHGVHPGSSLNEGNARSATNPESAIE